MRLRALWNQIRKCGEGKGKGRSGMSEADAPVVGTSLVAGC